ncbi:histidine kinase [Paucilactobacillus hokkaidonensis JCM 18461]|uniref:Histidine kinase n=3 Tax=Paucilactobacillus hokkaidonensis TaxID=1193095 RepID=A0A0A1GTP6_9LACO|nr:GHKL domain-containing protein [Paucilactobacillus hokkaidonensis]BAP85375.1 histidine kinase [Paucilactobacillus hokkaidonensis JCM 18461]
MIMLPQYIGQITDVFTLVSFFANLFIIEPKSKNRYNIIIAIISIVAISYIDLLYNLASVPLLAILYFIVLKRKQSSVSRWISNFVTALLFTFITAQLASFLTIAILQIPLGKVNNQLALLVILYFSLTIIITAFFLIARYLILKLISKINMDQRFAATIFGYNAATLLLFLTLAIAVTRWIGKESALASIILPLFGILAFIMLLITVILYSRNIENLQLAHKEELNKDNTLYVKELEKKYHEARKAKHDYKNMLFTLQVIAKNGNSNTLYESVSNLLQSDTEFDDDSYLTIHKINDPFIRGIITQKLTEAKEKNMKTSLEVTERIPDLGKINIIVTRILGILMDNAIEAAIKSEDHRISVAVISTDSNIRFLIKNSVAKGTKININRIFEEEYSNKGSERGLGLSTVKDLTSHYDNLLISVTFTDTFTVILTLEKANQ